MKIAIHHRENSFSRFWLKYCKENKIPFKIVDCYKNSIIKELTDCDALMWHFHHYSSKDTLFAKQLLYSLETSGMKVFPDFNTAWHFDDKVGQKYLLEAIDAPLVPSYVFFDKEDALQWIDGADFPKVFKLRRGSGSDHVKLVKNKNSAYKFVQRAFDKGFSQYDSLSNLKERWRKYRHGTSTLKNVFKGIFRMGLKTKFAKVAGNEKGYVYFQDFIKGNEYDIRIIVIGNQRAFAIKRLNRKNDFRASGSGNSLYEKDQFDDNLIQLSFNLAEKVKSKSLAIDYLFDKEKPLITELSYGFPTGPFIEDCHGYWDSNLKWHEGPFDALGWMVESLINDIRNKTTQKA